MLVNDRFNFDNLTQDASIIVETLEDGVITLSDMDSVPVAAVATMEHMDYADETILTHDASDHFVY